MNRRSLIDERVLEVPALRPLDRNVMRVEKDRLLIGSGTDKGIGLGAHGRRC
jgi:hypothetical protein